MHVDPFVDTNVWIYAHLDDENEPRCTRAWDLVNQLSRPVISPQVIAEYYNTMRRNQREDSWIRKNLQDMLSHCELQSLGRAVVEAALDIRVRYGFSYWDCQIIAAALEADCELLYTEDMQDGQVIDGRLKVFNPLL